MSNLRLGTHASITVGYPFSSKHFSADTGIRLLRGANVKRGTLDWAPSIARYWPEKDSSLHTFELQAGDIVVAMDGALVGMSCARVTEQDLPAYLVQRVARIRCDSALDQSFTFHLLTSSLFLRHVSRRKTHTAIPHITKRDIEDFGLPPYPITVQQRIGLLLDGIDAASRTVSDLHAARAAQRASLATRLLSGSLRLPAFSPTGNQSECLPQGWRRCRLQDIADVSFSAVDKVVQPDECPVRLCNYMNVWKHDYIDDAELTDRGSATERELARFRLQPGDVVLTKDSETREDIGSPAFVRAIGTDVVLGYHLALVRPKSGVTHGGFVAKQLALPEFRRQFVRAASGATRYGLSLSAVRLAEVVLPPFQEQEAISTFLERCDTHMALLKSKHHQLRSLKRTLLNHVISGRLSPKVSTLLLS
jgi:hypothetical protein